MRKLINPAGEKMFVFKKISIENLRSDSLLHLALIGSIVVILFQLGSPAQAQQFDLLLKGGHVIDPKNGIDQPMDVAIRDDVIARVATDISTAEAKRVVNANGLFVTPGLIDMHGHVFHQEVTRAVKPDGFTFRVGVTTIVDAGTSGWRNFKLLKKQTGTLMVLQRLYGKNEYIK